MSHFKKLCVTFSILKLQKSDAYENGVEFRHKPDGYDAMCPPPFILPSAVPDQTILWSVWVFIRLYLVAHLAIQQCEYC